MKITDTMKQEIEEMIEAFNEKCQVHYEARYEGEYLYLDKNNTHIGRLSFNGDINSCSFDVYDYPSEEYEPRELNFYGNYKLTGTI